MQLNRFRVVFIVSALILEVVALAVTGVLNMVSFRQNYTHSLVSSYAVLANQPVRKIQYALEYGKPLQNFYGMNSLLNEIRVNDKDISNVEIVTLDGRVLYNLNKSTNSEVKYLPSMLRSTILSSTKASSGYAFAAGPSTDNLFVPILNRKKPVGALRLEFPSSVIQKPVHHFIVRLLAYLGLFAVLSTVVLIGIFLKVRFVTSDGQIRRRRLLVSLIAVLGGIQMLYAIPNYELLAHGYLSTVRENTKLVVRVIQEDIHSVVGQGVPYSDLNGLSVYLRQMIQHVPEIQSVSIVNSDFTSNPNKIGGTLSGYTYSVPLADDSAGNSKYSIITVLSQPFIFSHTVQILLDALTIMVVSMLLTYEFTVTMLTFIRRRVVTTSKERTHAENDKSAVRPVGFGVFAGLYLTSAFTPLIMNELYRPLWGLPRSLVIGLPISVEMGCVAISSMIAGYLMDMRGWKSVFIGGTTILFIATLMSAFTHHEVVFIGVRALAGLGFGASLVSMQNFVVSTKDERNKNDGLSALNAGAYAGINTGAVVGGMIALHLGFSAVYMVASVVILAGLAYALFYLPSSDCNTSEGTVISPDPNLRVQASILSPTVGMVRFMANGKVSLFLLAILLPVSICGMFLYYYFPIFASEHGVNTADIGRAFLLNGLCVVYLGPVISRWTDKYLGYIRAVFASGLLTASSILWFSLHSVPSVAFVVVALLGLSDGFGVTSNINYFISIPAALRLGEGKAMGYYGLVENAGQMLGPMAFAAATTSAGNGIAVLAGLLAVGSGVFMASTRWLGRQKPSAHPS